MHLNPNVQEPVGASSAAGPASTSSSPWTTWRSSTSWSAPHLIITDSGGIQEEAPSLGKPVLVMRTVTERPEAVEAGTVKLVGTDTDAIVAAAERLLDAAAAYAAMSPRPQPLRRRHGEPAHRRGDRA